MTIAFSGCGINISLCVRRSEALFCLDICGLEAEERLMCGWGFTWNMLEVMDLSRRAPCSFPLLYTAIHRQWGRNGFNCRFNHCDKSVSMPSWGYSGFQRWVFQSEGVVSFRMQLNRVCISPVRAHHPWWQTPQVAMENVKMSKFVKVRALRRVLNVTCGSILASQCQEMRKEYNDM